MTFFFIVDPATGSGSFYDTSLFYDWGAIAGSRVRITNRRHALLMAAQADGDIIKADSKGRPVIVRQRVSREVALDALRRQIKREAARRINDRMPIWRQINALRDSSDPGFHEIDAIREASNLIEQHLADLKDTPALLAFDVASCPLWPEFEKGADHHA